VKKEKDGKEEGGNRRGKKSGRETNTRQYCTQECLHGLLTGGILDRNCPNVKDHCSKAKDLCQHVVNSSTFLRMMRNQLAFDRDTDCKPLYIQGARGALFKLTLTSYGYTVAAKGTISAFTPYLRHEAAVYKRLSSIQGIYVPVCLGAIDLVRPYYHNGDQITHMLLLSWGGTRLDRHINRDNESDVMAQAITSLQAIHQLGVLHQDAMPRNMLWNTEGKRVMVVDFERAELAKSQVMKKRVKLRMISPNQRSTRKRKAQTKLDGKRSMVDENNGTQFIMEVKRMRVGLAQCVL